MSQGTQSATTMQTAVREHLQDLCVQGEGFLKRFSAALLHDAQRQAGGVHQPITEEDLKAEVTAMTDTMKSLIQTPGAGGLAQFLLPRLFRACLEEVKERHNFIRSIFFPQGASTTNGTTVAMRDHIIAHHETLFHLTPGKEHERAIARILGRVGKYLANSCAFPEEEVAQVVWNGDLDKVAVAYLRVVVCATIQDPAVRFEGNNNDQRATAAASSTSESQTNSGVNVVLFSPELHSDPVYSDNREILNRRCVVIFPAILRENGTKFTRSYTVRYNEEDTRHPDLGMSSSLAAPIDGLQRDSYSTTAVKDQVLIQGAAAQARNRTGRVNYEKKP